VGWESIHQCQQNLRSVGSHWRVPPHMWTSGTQQRWRPFVGARFSTFRITCCITPAYFLKGGKRKHALFTPGWSLGNIGHIENLRWEKVGSNLQNLWLNRQTMFPRSACSPDDFFSNDQVPEEKIELKHASNESILNALNLHINTSCLFILNIMILKNVIVK